MNLNALHPSWQHALRGEFEAEYMANLFAFLAAKEALGKQMYPPENQWFEALRLTPLDAVKAVILGQDPYPGAGKAHGLAFSVQPGVAVPASLRNVYKELQSDLGIRIATHGHLRYWAEQGVLLLNTLLTVEQGKPMAHKNRGWERFTDAVIAAVHAQNNPVVFMLWGDKAKAKATDISAKGRHLVLATSHPSSMGGAAHRGFFGCKHFSQCNAFLEQHGRATIDWSLPDLPFELT